MRGHEAAASAYGAVSTGTLTGTQIDSLTCMDTLGTHTHTQVRDQDAGTIWGALGDTWALILTTASTPRFRV